MPRAGEWAHTAGTAGQWGDGRQAGRALITWLDFVNTPPHFQGSQATKTDGSVLRTVSVAPAQSGLSSAQLKGTNAWL